MKTSTIILILMTLMFSMGCQKSKLHTVSGTLKDFTGLSGCDWIIELDEKDKYGNKRLEPINLHDFKIKLREGKRVKLRYVERLDLGSFCMVGSIVEIKSIRKQ